MSVAPGETQRLVDVLSKEWSLNSSVGVVTIEPAVAGGPLPAALGESYRSPLAGKRYGHSLPVLAEEDAAEAGQSQTLAGLRQGSNHRATIWVLNPGSGLGEYDVIYRGLDGSELGRIVVKLAAGKVRQLNPPQHPLPEAGAPDGFTVEVRVRGGKVLASAQMVNTATGDSAYIQGVRSVTPRGWHQGPQGAIMLSHSLKLRESFASRRLP